MLLHFTAYYTMPTHMQKKTCIEIDIAPTLLFLWVWWRRGLVIDLSKPPHIPTNQHTGGYLFASICWKMLYKIKQCRYALWDLRKSGNNNQTPKTALWKSLSEREICQHCLAPSRQGFYIARAWERRKYLPLGNKFLILISKENSF